jgi:hypothetical protein
MRATSCDDLGCVSASDSGSHSGWRRHGDGMAAMPIMGLDLAYDCPCVRFVLAVMRSRQAVEMRAGAGVFGRTCMQAADRRQWL